MADPTLSTVQISPVIYLPAIRFPNNNFADANLLTGVYATASGSNVGMTKETGEPNHAGSAGGRSAWFKWVAPASGVCHLNTRGSAFDTLLGVYTGSAVNALTTIASDDDSGGSTTSLLSFAATGGTTYYIAIDGFNFGSGNYILNLNFAPMPATVAAIVVVPSPFVSPNPTPTPSVVAVAAIVPPSVATDNAAHPNAINVAPVVLAPIVPLYVRPAAVAVAATAFTPTISFTYRGSIATTFAFSAPADATANTIRLTTDTTLFPERIGVTVGVDSAAHTVVAGVSSRTAGAAAILTGDYAFRGLYAFDTTGVIPGNFSVDARDWVTLASWGDFQFRIRRQVTTGYTIRADYITAALTPTHAQASLTISNDDPVSIGLGVTRNATTGAIQMWRSDDGWVSWTPILSSSASTTAGALADSIPEGLVLLGGDLQDGPWISIFQAQWGATTDITAVDAAEVTAWNYGTGIVTGVGGDYYDTFNRAAKNSWELGSETSYVYSQRYQTTNAGTTVRVNFTFNADTLNTATAPAGTSAAFTYDNSPQWENGPALTATAPPILFSSQSQFTVRSYNAGALTRGSDGTGLPYRVILVDMNGTPQRALANAMVDPITWSLNEVESFSFRMPVFDPLVAEIQVAFQEVQIWRGDDLLIWGVIVRSGSSTDGEMEYQCRGLGWYFTKRFVGGPRYNYLLNPSFEMGDAWWFIPKFSPTENPLFGLDGSGANWTAEVTSEQSITGYPGRSLKLYSNGLMEFGVGGIQFFFHDIDSPKWPDGITWTAAAWAYIPSDGWGVYDDEADKIVGERNAAYNWGGESSPFGLHLGRFAPGEFQDQDAVAAAFPKVYEITVAGITEETPRDQWVRLETSLVQPPQPDGIEGRIDWIQVELHAPRGTVFWDEVSVTRNERLFYNDVAQESILFDIIQHAQDTTLGKSDLNIGFAAAPFTYVNRTRTYEYFNREKISDIIDEFSTLWDGCDWSIETTPTQRLFSPWFPMKGTRRPAQSLILGKNIASVSVANDGEQIATRVAIISDTGGTGSSRNEEFGTSVEDGELILEESINATKESPLDSLEGQLQRALRQKQNGTIPTLTTYEGVGSQLIGEITTGDIVLVDVAYGGTVLYGEHRIVAITLNPDTDTMDVTLNPFTDYTDPVLA